GKWITPARLKVMPYALRCRACQEEKEERQKALAT
ncbi:MAG: TraR/DksA C4-type zinc finger protein, partial [Deltaproteobacteria bacterium]|nr:TraR/DksA C4-type zinc finger protein [Deltaproteobacteria bacterium]